MNDDKALEIVDKIFLNVFGTNNKYSMDELLSIFAYDIDVPRRVVDVITKKETWTDFPGNNKYVNDKNMYLINNNNWDKEKYNFSTLSEIIDTWNEINYIPTERITNSERVYKSDTIFNSRDVYNSTSSSNSNNIVYSDCCNDCEYVLASKGANGCNNCIRVYDSSYSSNSFSIIWSNKIVNSLFIQNCNNLYECMFCSHIGNKKYCICNMQFEEKEYFEYKKKIIEWILK